MTSTFPEKWKASRSKRSKLSRTPERRAAGEHGLDAALQAVAEALSVVTGANAVVVRVADGAGMLHVRSVVSGSEALAAELAGSSFSSEELLGYDGSRGALPAAVAGRLAADAAAEPCSSRSLRMAGASRASSCCARGKPFGPADKAAAQVAASQVGLVLRAFASGNGAGRADGALLLAGDALGAALDGSRGPEEIARVACRASGAEAALLWQPEGRGSRWT